MTKRPISEHRYHGKSDDELRYIMRDAHEAAIAMRGVDSAAECKYLDQINDAATVLGYRKSIGESFGPTLRHGHVGIFNRNCDQCRENGT